MNDVRPRVTNNDICLTPLWPQLITLLVTIDYVGPMMASMYFYDGLCIGSDYVYMKLTAYM